MQLDVMNQYNQETLLEAKNIEFKYSKNSEAIFSGLSMNVLKGEAILLMGPSGCGKSSLAYCLAGLYPTYAGQLKGEISLLGNNINQMNPCERSKLVSILFQNPDNQFCMDSVCHEILFALENINYSGDLYAKMEELLDLVELRDVKDAPIYTLSGGTKQKIALATALATGAKLLILDEPLANLDPASCIMVVKMLRKLHQNGLTLFIVDHKPELWRSFVTKVRLMDRNGVLSNESINPVHLEKYRKEFSDRGIFLDDSWVLDFHPPKVEEDSVVAELENVKISYDKKLILSDVNLRLKRGSISVLVGGNGNGKTTLLSAMAGIIPCKGTVKINERVGLVFQNPRFQFLTLSVEEEVMETLSVVRKGASKEELTDETTKLLEEFNLLKFSKASPYALSQGQQRRLALLSMLAGDRPILLLDEPTYAQDEQATCFILNLIKKRVQEGLTVVISTHDLILAQAIANQVFLVEGGGVRELSKQELESYIEDGGKLK